MSLAVSDKLIQDLVAAFVKQLQAQLAPSIATLVTSSVSQQTSLGSKQSETLAALAKQAEAAAKATQKAEDMAKLANQTLESAAKELAKHQLRLKQDDEQLQKCQTELLGMPDKLKHSIGEITDQFTQGSLTNWLVEMKVVHASWRTLQDEVKREHAEVVLERAELVGAKSELESILSELRRSKDEMKELLLISQETAKTLKRGVKEGIETLRAEQALRRASRAIQTALKPAKSRPKKPIES